MYRFSLTDVVLICQEHEHKTKRFKHKQAQRHTNKHSFIPAISIAPLQVLYYSEALPTTARILYRSFTQQATAGKGLAQGPYMAARAGVEPTTLRLKAIDSPKAPPCPTCRVMFPSLCHVM